MGKEQGDFLEEGSQTEMVRPADGATMLVSTPAQRVRAVAAGYRDPKPSDDGEGATSAPATAAASASSAPVSAPEASATPDSTTARRGQRSTGAQNDGSEHA